MVYEPLFEVFDGLVALVGEVAAVVALGS